jgi:hypothetical protein
MSRIDELRKNEKNQINLVKIIESLVPDKKTKYIELLTRIIHEEIDKKMSEYNLVKMIEDYKSDNFSSLEKYFLIFIIERILSKVEIEEFNYFCDKFESNALKGVDLQTLSAEDVVNHIVALQEIDKEKELEKATYKLVDNDEWLVLLPLTYESSKKYGANTKWCTASEDTDENYYNYASEGILVYIINRITNVKHAIFYDLENMDEDTQNSITLWNAEDKPIELFLAPFPDIVLNPIKNYFINTQKPNQELYSDLFPEKEVEVELAPYFRYNEHQSSARGYDEKTKWGDHYYITSDGRELKKLGW